MNVSRLSPYIRLATDSVLTQKWRLNERVIFDFELLYLKEGQFLVTIEGEEFHGHPGDIFFIRPKERHSLTSIGDVPVRQPHVHFDFFEQNDSADVKVSFRPLHEINETEQKWFRDTLPDDSFFQLPSHFRLRNPLVFEKMLFHLIEEYEQKMPYYETNLKGMFAQLWVYLVREHYWDHHSVTKTHLIELNRIQEYLKHEMNRDVTLDELASVSNISKYHLSRLFKTTFGISPIQYHRRIRLERAKLLIQFSDWSITKVAEHLGFTSIHSFSRAFKQMENVSPTYYRRKTDRDSTEKNEVRHNMG